MILQISKIQIFALSVNTSFIEKLQTDKYNNPSNGNDKYKERKKNILMTF